MKLNYQAKKNLDFYESKISEPIHFQCVVDGKQLSQTLQIQHDGLFGDLDYISLVEVGATPQNITNNLCNGQHEAFEISIGLIPGLLRKLFCLLDAEDLIKENTPAGAEKTLYDLLNENYKKVSEWTYFERERAGNTHLQGILLEQDGGFHPHNFIKLIDSCSDIEQSVCQNTNCAAGEFTILRGCIDQLLGKFCSLMEANEQYKEAYPKLARSV